MCLATSCNDSWSACSSRDALPDRVFRYLRMPAAGHCLVVVGAQPVSPGYSGRRLWTVRDVSTEQDVDQRRRKGPVCFIVQYGLSVSLPGRQLLENHKTLPTLLLPTMFLWRTARLWKLSGDNRRFSFITSNKLPLLVLFGFAQDSLTDHIKTCGLLRRGMEVINCLQFVPWETISPTWGPYPHGSPNMAWHVINYREFFTMTSRGRYCNVLMPRKFAGRAHPWPARGALYRLPTSQTL